MPSQTSSETAQKLKQRINRSNKFVLLATPGSIRSIWIPWELGLADGVKGLNKIAILPLVKMKEHGTRENTMGFTTILNNHTMATGML